MIQADFLENDTLKNLLAADVAAYAAMRNRDRALAEKTWGILINELLEQNGKEGFVRENRTTREYSCPVFTRPIWNAAMRSILTI